MQPAGGVYVSPERFFSALYSLATRHAQFKCCLFHFRVTTLDKSFTHIYICPSSINWYIIRYRPTDSEVLGVWGGRFGISLATRHGISDMPNRMGSRDLIKETSIVPTLYWTEMHLYRRENVS